MSALHPVLQLIGERLAAEPDAGGRRSDGCSLALVEGGAMRGVVSSAMTDVVEELGMLPAIDLVVGTSAGALNAAALLAGVARGCTEEYAEGFATRDFINPARLLLGRPAVDVDYVLDFHSDRLDADRHGRTLSSPISASAGDVGSTEG
jgi:predicted patatin/cPLA2 family phospholipase